ncbi:hypothetical protein OG21DRAFT_1572936, partial [Imleria badia]
DEDALIDMALSNKAMAGDGGNFRGSFWNEVASNFPPPTQGKAKTAESCKEKWKRLKTIYEGVNKIAGTSGLAYSLEKGADIGLDSLQIWDDIMKVCSHHYFLCAI